MDTRGMAISGSVGWGCGTAGEGRGKVKFYGETRTKARRVAREKDRSVTGSGNQHQVESRLFFLKDDELIAILKRTTDHFEANENSTAGFDKLEPEYVQKMSKAIVAFEMEVEEIKHVFKLSQNRDKKSFLNIIEKLEAMPDEDSRTIAAEMKKRIS